MSNEVHRLQAYTIRRKFYKGSKYMLDFFLPPVETIYTPGYYQVNPGAILYFNIPWKQGDDKNCGKSFAIRQTNIRRVVRTLATALNWFDSINDLFVSDPTSGVLYFNTGYNHLKAVYQPKYFEPPQVLKIVPVALEKGNGVYEEGVILYMNRLENILQLTKEELQELYDLLNDFDFPSEIQICYQALLLSFNTGALKDGRDHQYGALKGTG